MKTHPLNAGRRARQLVPALGSQAIVLSPPSQGDADDLKLFMMTLAGGLVFFGTFFS